eukprot:4605828-Prymnesium_polylepis.1
MTEIVARSSLGSLASAIASSASTSGFVCARAKTCRCYPRRATYRVWKPASKRQDTGFGSLLWRKSSVQKAKKMPAFACCWLGHRLDETLLEPEPTKDEDPPPMTSAQIALGACVAFYYLVDGLVMTQSISYLPDYFEAQGLSQLFVGLSTFVQYFGMCFGALACNWSANYFGSVVRRAPPPRRPHPGTPSL